MSELIANPQGGYRFLPGIEPYCSGVVAEPGWEIVHATLSRPMAWQQGLIRVRSYLEGIGRSRQSLCGLELRCPQPYSMDGFVAFNQHYRYLLEHWDMLVDGQNPVARTNVAPAVDAPFEPVLFGFSYTIESSLERPTFVVAGSGELPGPLNPQKIVRRGETGADALLEKAAAVVQIMKDRLRGLGSEEHLSSIRIYTSHDLQAILTDVVIPGLPTAASAGVRWFFSKPPVVEIEFEMDLLAVRQELIVDLF